MLTQFSLGNIGGSEPVCKQFPMLKKNISLACTVGVLDTSKVTDNEIGIISSLSGKSTYCQYD
jgi:hypothetical protein